MKVDVTKKVLRVKNGFALFVEVDVSVEIDLALRSPQIIFALSGAGWVRHGDIEDAAPTGYDHWEAGAEAGATVALRLMQFDPVKITINRMSGQDLIDTNPWIVAEAVAKAIFEAMQYKPAETVIQGIEEIVNLGFRNPKEVKPNFDSLFKDTP